MSHQYHDALDRFEAKHRAQQAEETRCKCVKCSCNLPHEPGMEVCLPCFTGSHYNKRRIEQMSREKMRQYRQESQEAYADAYDLGCTGRGY